MGITFMGNPLTLEGNKLNVGDKAPDFRVLDNELNPKTLKDYEGKIKVISAVPSLDTDVCDQQTRKFNQELVNLDNVVVLTISNDLPFAQARWCGASGLENVITLSDHYDLDFSTKYGLHIKELRLLSRAVFVVNENNEIKYVEYLEEITNHPNYEAAIQAVKSL